MIVYIACDDPDDPIAAEAVARLARNGLETHVASGPGRVEALRSQLAADAVYLLPGWTDTDAGLLAHDLAVATGQRIYGSGA